MNLPGFLATALLALAIETAYAQHEGGFLCLPPKQIRACTVKCKATCANPNPSGKDCEQDINECGQGLDCVCPSHMVQRSNSDDTCVAPTDCGTTDPCEGINCPGQKICVDGSCICPEGTHDHDDDACVTCPGRKIYQRCGHNCPINCEEREPRPCTRECRLDNYCICPPGYIERSNDDRSCILPSDCPVVEPCGGRCRDPFVCVDEECVCPEGTNLHMGDCVTCPGRKIFQPCASNCPANCADRSPVCTEECRPENFCACPNGFIERGASDPTCIRPSRCPVVEPCGGRCRDPLVCVNEECVCPEGTDLHNGDCVSCPGNQIFQPCASNCPASCDNRNPICTLECRPENFCACRRGFILRGGGDPTCIRPSQCPVIDPCDDVTCDSPFICMDGECVCPEGSNPHNGDCVTCPGRKLFQPCAPNCPTNCDQRGPRPCSKECRVDNFCVCPDGYIERSESDRTCIRPSQCPTDPCATVLCESPYVCDGGSCVCPEGTHDHNGDCVTCPGMKIFQPCATVCPENCEERGPRRCPKICNLSNYCVCPEGYIEASKTDRRCIKPSECQTNPCAAVSCILPFICVNGQCVCPEGMRLHHGKCVEECPYPTVYTDCATMCEPTCENQMPSICPLACRIDVHCVCRDGWVQTSKDDPTCIRKEQCKDDCAYKTCPFLSICMKGECRCLFPCPKNKRCVDGRCECMEGYSEDEYGRCEQTLHPCALKFCAPPQICRVNRITGRGECVCMPGSVKVGGRCVLGNPCDIIDCGRNRKCVEEPRGFGKCVCMDGYILDDIGLCIDRCAVMRCGANTDCRMGICHCLPGYVREKDGPSCIKKDKCATMVCRQPDTVCKDGRCQCRDGYRKIRGVCRAIGSCYTKRCRRNEICEEDYLGIGHCIRAYE